MRISSIFMPFFTLVAGAIGYYIRLLEIMNVFDARTGLPERGAGITYALIAFSAVVMIIILMFTIRASTRYKALNGFENAFGTDQITYPVIISVVGAAWLGATVKQFVDLYAMGPIPMTELCFLILSALSAVSLALFAIEMYQDPRRKIIFALSIVPTMFMCFWLIMLYRQNASNPVLLSYCYKCLAIITAALGFYFTSGFVYNKPAPGKAIFFYFAAVYFCFVTLADDHTFSMKIVIIALIAVNTIYSSMLIKNLQWKLS